MRASPGGYSSTLNTVAAKPTGSPCSAIIVRLTLPPFSKTEFLGFCKFCAHIGLAHVILHCTRFRITAPKNFALRSLHANYISVRRSLIVSPVPVYRPRETVWAIYRAVIPLTVADRITMNITLLLCNTPST